MHEAVLYSSAVIVADLSLGGTHLNLLRLLMMAFTGVLDLGPRAWLVLCCEGGRGSRADIVEGETRELGIHT